jgi:hypothetical protein
MSFKKSFNSIIYSFNLRPYLDTWNLPDSIILPETSRNW